MEKEILFVLCFHAENMLVEVKYNQNKAGLKKLFVCRHPPVGLQVGSVGRDFFYISESQSRSQGFAAF